MKLPRLTLVFGVLLWTGLKRHHKAAISMAAFLLRRIVAVAPERLKFRRRDLLRD